MARHEHPSLWALAAGELDAEARGRVGAHVATCAECAQALEQVRQSRAVLQDARGATPPLRSDAMPEGLRAEAARRMTRDTSAVRWPWAVALAGVCAVVLAIWMVRAPRARDEDGALVARTEGPALTAPATPVAANKGDATPTTPVQETPESAAHAAAGSGTSAPTDTAAKPDATIETERVAVAGATLRDAGGTERALQPGMKLRSGVAVRTPPRSSALLRLPDESRVRLSAGSEVELTRAESRDVQLTVNKGRLSVEASHAAREGFLVEVAGLRVSVVGTLFTVERTKDGAAVAVAEGQVRVEAEGQPPRLVSAGERVELHAAKHTLNPRKMSKPDLRAIAELREPEAEAPKALSTRPAPTRKPEPAATTPGAVAAVTPAPQEHAASTPDAMAAVTPSPQKPATEAIEPAPPPANALAPVAAAGTTPAVAPARADPSQEFAPYPVPSVNGPQPPAPAPQTPPEAVANESKKKRGPMIPMALVSRDADERFLGYARLQVNSRKCESFLVGLDEIAQRSPKAAHREQARYLRARCFEEKLESHRAKDEYRRYLNDFPRGRYAKEAKTGLLP